MFGEECPIALKAALSPARVLPFNMAMVEPINDCGNALMQCHPAQQSTCSWGANKYVVTVTQHFLCNTIYALTPSTMFTVKGGTLENWPCESLSFQLEGKSFTLLHCIVATRAIILIKRTRLGMGTWPY